MKWLFLGLAALCFVPVTLLIRRTPTLVPGLWTAIALMPFIFDNLHLLMALNSWALWPGFVKGIEINGLDLLLVIAYFASPKVDERFPFRLSMGLYLFAVLIGVTQSAVPIASLFYVWQLLKVFFLVVVTSRACSDPRIALAVLWGLALGVGLEAIVTLWQRTHGMTQAVGTFGHQNMLGMIVNMSAMAFAAVFMAKSRSLISAAVPLLGAVVVILTASRATLGLFVLGIALICVFSLIRRFSAGKLGVVLSCAALLAIAAPFAMGSLNKRFAENPLDQDYDERAVFIKAATFMIDDYPFGIGANNYVTRVNTGGYNERAGVAPVYGSLAAHVHNAYILTMAENGYFGLISLILVLFAPIAMAFRKGWRVKDDIRSAMC